MALEDALSLTDDKLEAVFNQKPYDPAKDRNRIINGINGTLEKFKNGGAKGRKWFTERNGVVKFTPPFAINGRESHLIPAQRFPDFLGHLRLAVTAGELDDAIKSTGALALATPDAKRTRAGWSPERRARAALKGGNISTEDQRYEAARLKAEGGTNAQIAEALGFPLSFVSNILKGEP